MLERFLLNINQEKVQQLHSLLRKQKDMIKFGQIEVKSLTKHFWIFSNKMKYKIIQSIQI